MVNVLNSKVKQLSLDSTSSGSVLSPTQSSGLSTNSSSDVSSLLSARSSRTSATSYDSVAEHACITLHGIDRMRLFGFGEETTKRIVSCIQSHWPAGLAHHPKSLGDGAIELKVAGRIWISACRFSFTGKRCPGTTGQVVLAHVLEDLSKLGYELIAVSDVGFTTAERDSLYFRRASPATPAPCGFFIVQFDAGGDRLRVTKAPDDVYAGFRHIFAKQKHTETQNDGSLLFKFAGLPLVADGATEVSTRFLLLTMLDMISASGHELVASIDMSAGGEGGMSRTWIIRSIQG